MTSRSALSDPAYWLLGLTALVAAATVAITLALWGTGEAGLLLASRYTVRVSFPLFLLTYIARPAAQLWRGERTRWLLRHRRHLGLSFALAHTVHLAALTAFFLATPHTPAPATLIGGGLAYLLIFAMALTSNNASQRRLGRTWHRLHLVGMHYVWFIFAFTYYGRLAGGREGATEDLSQVGAIGFTMCLAALAIRTAAFWRSKRNVSVA